MKNVYTSDCENIVNVFYSKKRIRTSDEDPWRVPRFFFIDLLDVFRLDVLTTFLIFSRSRIDKRIDKIAKY